jgi:hypothetical protein
VGGGLGVFLVGGRGGGGGGCKNLCSHLPGRLSHNKVLHLDRLRPYTQVEKTLQAHTL